jgi:asparagine synthase (glutamine-hydrolysing)
MCGISGFLHFDSNRNVSLDTLKRMSKTLIHRGPDGHGFYSVKNIALAHQRLSIIDLSLGHQPMTNNDGKIVIVFNGEIYNYVELRNELISLGYSFKTQSDTEVIIQAYEQWGINLHSRLNGMWSFALWDARRKELLLSRDRLGEKPLHYTLWDNSIIFSSEIKGIMAYGIKRELNLEVLSLYLTLGFIPAPYTFFKNVQKLQPGHFITIKNGKLKQIKYWDLPDVEEDSMLHNKNQVDEKFQYLLYDSIRLRMRSDVSYGAFLSGGLDSSSIVALMSKIGSNPPKTFTISFEDKNFDEAPLALKAADKFKTIHYVKKVTPDFFEENIKDVLHHFDEPFGDSSAIPTGYVARYARTQVKMVLTGDGGDEVLSGYNSYQSEKFAEYYQYLPLVFRRIIPSILDFAGTPIGGTFKYKLHWLSSIMKTFNTSFNERLLTKAAWSDLYLISEIMGPLLDKTINIRDYLSDFMNGCDYRDSFYRLMYYDLKLSLPERMLVKVDRMTMAHSLEARVPFLDHRLVEFLIAVSKSVKMDGLQRKAILRRTIGCKLPNEILRGRKKGFALPLTKWFMEQQLTENLINLYKYSGLEVNITVIKKIVDQHKSGYMDHGNLIWMLFILGRWLHGG